MENYVFSILLVALLGLIVYFLRGLVKQVSGQLQANS